MSLFTESSTLPVVVIVGRPNVGKSALFNRIVGRRLAIVHEEAGVTRDRIMAPAVFEDRRFVVVDTGGIGFFLDEKRVPVFDELIREQVQKVLDDAARIIMVVDVQAGITPLDLEIAQYLRRSGRPITVAINKADDPGAHTAAIDTFLSLGFEALVPTSCQHGMGVGDVLEQVLKGIEPSPPVTETDSARKLHLAVVGRPNVGKSSLVNCLLGQDRMIVSDIAGTTRDAVNTDFVLKQGNKELPAVLVDTAGLRKRGHVDSAVERFSMMRAEKAIEQSDLVLFVFDASLPSTAQDRRIARAILDARKPCILVANKWDLLAGDMKLQEFEKELRYQMPFVAHAPLVTLSALEKRNLGLLIKVIMRVADALQLKIPTSVLNQFLHDLVLRTPPPVVSSKFLKMFYATMRGTAPPCITMFVNHTDLCPAAYRTFLENRVREAFFPESGLPISIEMRARSQMEGRQRPPPKPRTRRSQTAPHGSDQAHARPSATKHGGRNQPIRPPRGGQAGPQTDGDSRHQADDARPQTERPTSHARVNRHHANEAASPPRPGGRRHPARAPRRERSR